MNEISTSTQTIFKLATPMLLSLILEQIIGLTDIIFLGRVSEVSVGAAAIGGIGFYTLTMIAFGYSIASQSMMGEANGAKRYGDVGRIFQQSGLFLLFFSVVILVLMPMLMEPVFAVLVHSPEVREEAQAYFFLENSWNCLCPGRGSFPRFFHVGFKASGSDLFFCCHGIE